MTASVRPSSYSYVVDEPLLRTIASEIQAAIPGAEVRLFGSRARGNERPDSDLDLLLYSHQEVQDRLQHSQQVVKEAYSHGQELHER
jgi:predicted nucleotidyltransferase